MIRSVPHLNSGTVADPRRSGAGGDGAGLKPGMVFKATVVKTLDPGSVMVRINGREMTARTQVPLRQGTVVSLKVRQASGPLVLQVLDQRVGGRFSPRIGRILSILHGNPWKTLLAHLNQKPSALDDLGRLKAALDGLIREPWRDPGPEMLRTVIDRSGLFWESKLRRLLETNRSGKESASLLAQNDLKGALAKCITGGKDNGDLIRRLFSLLEQVQRFNHVARQEDGRLFLPLPLQLPDGETNVAQILIRPDREEAKQRPEDSEGGFRLSLVMALSAMGPLRIDLSVRQNRIRSVFMVAREASRQVILAQMPQLGQRLADQGFSFECSGCLLRDAKTVSRSPLIDDGAKADAAQIDCMA